MAKKDLISGAAMFLFGIVMLAYVIPQEIVEGGDYTISPALLPKICAIGITALSALLVAKAAGQLRGQPRAGGAEDAEEARPMPWGPALFALTVIAAATAIFRLVHPGLAAVFLVLALMLYMGERRWYLLAGLPLSLVGIAYVLFYEILGMVVR